MAREPKPPAFQFYAKDWFLGTRSLGVYGRGVYIDMLAMQWDTGPIDDDPELIADSVGADVKQVRKLWPRLREKFDACAPGKMVNARLEDERRKQAEYREEQSRKGKASATARQQRQGNGVTEQPTEAQPDGNRGSTAVEPEYQPNGQPNGNSATASATAEKAEESSAWACAGACVLHGPPGEQADAAWLRLTGVLPGSGLSEARDLAAKLASLYGVEPWDAYLHAVAAFNALCDGGNLGFKPQKAPHKFVQRWEDVQQVLAGTKDPNQAAAQRQAAERAKAQKASGKGRDLTGGLASGEDRF